MSKTTKLNLLVSLHEEVISISLCLLFEALSFSLSLSLIHSPLLLLLWHIYGRFHPCCYPIRSSLYLDKKLRVCPSTYITVILSLTTFFSLYLLLSLSISLSLSIFLSLSIYPFLSWCIYIKYWYKLNMSINLFHTFNQIFQSIQKKGMTLDEDFSYLFSFSYSLFS